MEKEKVENDMRSESGEVGDKQLKIAIAKFMAMEEDIFLTVILDIDKEVRIRTVGTRSPARGFIVKKLNARMRISKRLFGEKFLDMKKEKQENCFRR